MAKLLEKTASTTIETDYGCFEFIVFLEKSNGKEHILLKRPWRGEAPLVRIHSECATGDIFSSVYCDCRGQLLRAMKRIEKDGGLLIYLRQEGRGIGLTDKIKAYELQRQGKDTVEANVELGREPDERGYDIAAEMLRDQKISSIKLLTNNPAKVKALEEEGFEVERVEHVVKSKSERGERYLKVKKEKMNHEL